MGARFYTGTKVTDLKMSKGRIDRVVTPKGEISASIVVNAAGLAFNAINEMAGIESFPMDLECIDAWVTSPVEKIRSPALTISYMDPFFLVSQRESLFPGGCEKLQGHTRQLPGRRHFEYHLQHL